MKKFLSLLIVMSLLLCPVLAVGDPNIDGGGGNMGDGTTENQWLGGDDGVRVSIMENKTAIWTWDFANKDWRNTIEYHFGYKTKKYYLRSETISRQTNYENMYELPENLKLPRIIIGDGTSNIDKIREYFTDEGTMRFIAEKAGMTYEQLTSGTYKLLLEPIAYFRFQGHWYAMTPSEMATYNKWLRVDGKTTIRSKMGSMTHCSFPLSMYLAEDDLGLSAPPASVLAGSGSDDYRASDDDIVQYLGVGIVKFKSPPTPPPDEYGEYTYHADIDVITSVVVENTLGRDMTPDTNDFVTFELDGVRKTIQIVCPEGSNQLVWIKWHTPARAKDMSITITAPSGQKTYLDVSIVELTENTPPDAEYDGPGTPGVDPGITHNQYRPNFTSLSAPSWGNNTYATWDIWVADLEMEWVENWVWVETVPEVKNDKGEIVTKAEGYWDDQGEYEEYWDFSLASYHASLWTDYELVPNKKVPTAQWEWGKWLMGSGYGVDANVEVHSSTNAGDSCVTPVQGVYAVFPEFDYTDYFRLLEPERSGWYRTAWHFAVNPYSYYGEQVHFTPVWFPDGKYEVAVAVYDVWTPAGMLYASLSDYVNIKGTMFDDWYIRSY